MKKATYFVDPTFMNNRIFDLTARDNCLYFAWHLREVLKHYGIDLSTQDINPVHSSEFVIYQNMPYHDPAGSPRSYLIHFEPEVTMPGNFDPHKLQFFHKVFTFHDGLVDHKKYIKIHYPQLFPESIDVDITEKQKLCTLINSNKTSHHHLELYSKRVEAIRWFESNHPEDFDLYGFGWDKELYPSYKGQIATKRDVLWKYKFSICYENCRDIPGYITEKIFDCFFAGCVPIYWGADNISTYIPRNCFIDKNDFGTYEQLYDFLTHMEEADYSAYLRCIRIFIGSRESSPFTTRHFVRTILQEVIQADYLNTRRPF